MPAKHVDFKYVRQHADIRKVLEHYGIEFKKDGQKEDQVRCLCPFHDDKDPSMKVNLERNIYNCFPCDEGGNVLDFVKKKEGIEIRAAAIAVAGICKIPTSATGTPPTKPKKDKKKKADKPTSPAADDVQDGVPYNKPLSFSLKNLQLEHPFFSKHGISDAMRDEFGLGIAAQGMMKDRFVFPIHNQSGELVAYCGRFVGDERPKDEPKYKQPPNFLKDLELFNLHRVDASSEVTVIIVESFLSTIKLHDMGYFVVSPMGRSLSKAQIELLKKGGVEDVILLLDGDDPGRKAIITMGRDLLEAGIDCMAPVVPENFKPHRCSNKEIEEILLRYEE